MSFLKQIVVKRGLVQVGEFDSTPLKKGEKDTAKFSIDPIKQRTAKFIDMTEEETIEYIKQKYMDGYWVHKVTFRKENDEKVTDVVRVPLNPDHYCSAGCRIN